MTGNVLPPGMSVAGLARVLAAIGSVIGPQWVSSDEQTLFGYRDPNATLDDDAFLPSAVIAPASVEEVRAILRIADQHGLYLWPVSTGKNYGYGGPAPRLKGSAILDLRRMNRIIEVNERLGYALVEPGVSYFDLYRHLRATGSKLWIDCASPGWGGVMGNALDRGAGYTPYADHWSSQCGLEVVLADGEVVRTGMGGVPAAKTWGAFKYGFGPYVDGLFSQSNFGVVTKIGIWLMPEPAAHLPIFIHFPDEDQLEEICEAVFPLRRSGLLNGGIMLAGLLWEGGGVSPRSRWYDGGGAMPPSAMRRMAADLDMGWWNLSTCLYGSAEQVERTHATIRDALAPVRGVRFHTAADRPGDPVFTYRSQLLTGQPNMYEFNLLNWTGGGGHVGFLPTCVFEGAEIARLHALCSRITREGGFDWTGEFSLQARSAIQVQLLQFDRSDPAVLARAHATYKQLIEACAGEGFGQFRTSLAFMDETAATYSFGDGAALRLSERIKDALDPNGILAPGKSGIWPKALRGTGHAM